MINLIQPLPFYDRLEEQTYRKENCPIMYKFLCYNDRLIPFQIRIPSNVTQIDSIILTGFTCEIEILLTASENRAVIKIVESGGQKWIVYNGEPFTFLRQNGSKSTIILKSDYYHFAITAGGKTYYSEKFYVNGESICDTPITLEIEAWNSVNRYGFTFDDGFKFRAFFNTFITNVVPEILDDYSKDGYERDLLNRRNIRFTYNFETDPVPSSITCGLAALMVLDNIYIKENGNEYRVKDITFTPESTEGGATDSILIGFTIFDQELLKTLC